MNRELWMLAAGGLRRRKKNSLLLFLVLFLSFAFSVASLVVTETIAKTNEEYLLNTYGAWQGAVPNASTKDETFLREAPWLDKLGITRSAGTFGPGYSIGTADNIFFEMSRFALQEGRMPRAANEIIIEASTLDDLGYDFKLGQTITLTIRFPAGFNKVIEAEVDFKLCGILRAYSKVWDISDRNGHSVLNNAFVSEDGFQRVRDAGNEEIARIRQEAKEKEEAGQGKSGLKMLSLQYLNTNYFFTFTGETVEVQNALKEYFTAGSTPFSRAPPVRNHVRYNYEAYGESLDPNITTTEKDRDNTAVLLYTGFIFLSVLLAIFCIYAVQMQKQVRQFALFRSIGITRRQLRKMMLFEMLILCVPAAALGAVAGTAGAAGIFRLLRVFGSANVQVFVPWGLLGPVALVWIFGILLTRLLILQIALREPLTGRINSDSRKLRRYRRLRTVMASGLAMLLCGSFIFTTAESFPPAHQLDLEKSKPAYQILAGNTKIQKSDMYRWEDILGVTGVRAVGLLLPNMCFEGEENAEAFQAALARLKKGDNVTGGGEIANIDGKDALVVRLYVLPDGGEDSYLNLSGSGIDLEAFRRGEQVAVSFPQEPDGSYFMDSVVYTKVLEHHMTMVSEEKITQDYKLHQDASDTGLEPGSSVTLEFMTAETRLSTEEALEAGYEEEYVKMCALAEIPIYGQLKAATLHPTIGAIVPILSGTDTSFMGLDEYIYVFWCSEAFVQNLLADVATRFPAERPVRIAEYTVGGSFGYTNAEVFTDSVTGKYTDIMMEEASAAADFDLTAQREEKTAQAQEHIQSLILLISSGGCIALLLLLVLGNTLVMESEKLKKNYGIMQALGMSKRQLRRKLLASALGRGMLGAAFGWLIWCGYVAARAAQLYFGQLDGPTVLRYQPLQALKEAFWRYLYAGAGIGAAVLLTVLVVALVMATSLFANRGLFRENLMDKLREES